MQLFAAVVPPPEALGQVRALLAGLAPLPEEPAQQFSWFSKRRAAEAAPAAGPMLDLLRTDVLHLPIAKFGNLATSDMTRLADALERQAPDWETPRLSFAGGFALEPEGDDGIWVSLSGDLEALAEVTRGVHRVAQGNNLFVDRRSFRPELRVAVINDRTTERFLETLLGVLHDFEGNAWWQRQISLLVPTDTSFRSVRDITLGPAVPH